MKPAGHVRLSRDRRPDQTRPTTARTRCPQPALGAQRQQSYCVLHIGHAPALRYPRHSLVRNAVSGEVITKLPLEVVHSWKTRLPWLTQRRIGCKAAPTPSSWSFTLGPNRLGTQRSLLAAGTTNWMYGAPTIGVRGMAWTIKKHTEYSVGRRFGHRGWDHQSGPAQHRGAGLWCSPA